MAEVYFDRLKKAISDRQLADANKKLQNCQDQIVTRLEQDELKIG